MINASLKQIAKGPSLGGLTAVGGIVSNFGSITAQVGGVYGYGNIESYNGNITASWGNIGCTTISSTSTITATGAITGDSISTAGSVSASTVSSTTMTTPSVLTLTHRWTNQEQERLLSRRSNRSRCVDLSVQHIVYR